MVSSVGVSPNNKDLRSSGYQKIGILKDHFKRLRDLITGNSGNEDKCVNQHGRKWGGELLSTNLNLILHLLSV